MFLTVTYNKKQILITTQYEHKYITEKDILWEDTLITYGIP